MRDHQLFERTLLPNGITVYTYQDAFPISCMELQLPVGSGHAIASNGFTAGSPHFLEHVQLIRSEAFPKPYGLDRELGMRAGNSNGATHSKATTHWIDTPATETKFGIDALIDRVFSPLFHEEDIVIERSVVANERNQHKFYPGKSRASQYYYQNFINDVFYPLEQIFGSDQDLASLTADKLHDLHEQVTTSQEIVALAVGNDDFSYLKERLAALPTRKVTLQHNVAPTSWENRDYHTVFFETVPQPRLEVAWIHPRLPYQEFRAICFILTLLINNTQGPLYREFREEKGWTYGIDGTCMLREQNTILGITFPVNTPDQVEYIRDCLAERIRTAVLDQKLIDDEIIRQLGNQVYSYQTAGSIVSAASSDLISQGTIHTEADFSGALRKMADLSWRTHILDTYFRPEEMGSARFMPERRRSLLG